MYPEGQFLCDRNNFLQFLFIFRYTGVYDLTYPVSDITLNFYLFQSADVFNFVCATFTYLVIVSP
jgi:hypothetical protein